MIRPTLLRFLDSLTDGPVFEVVGHTAARWPYSGAVILYTVDVLTADGRRLQYKGKGSVWRSTSDRDNFATGRLLRTLQQFERKEAP